MRSLVHILYSVFDAMFFGVIIGTVVRWAMTGVVERPILLGTIVVLNVLARLVRRYVPKWSRQ